MFEFKLELTNNINFIIKFTLYKGYPATHFEPGCDDEVDIEDIIFYGESLSQLQINSFIEDYGREDLEEWCFEQARLSQDDY